MIKKYLLIIVFILFVVIRTSYNSKAFSDENSSRSSTIKSDANQKQEKNVLSIKETVLVGGIKRSYYIFLPPNYNFKKSYPALMVFHGGEGNAKNILRMTKFKDYQSKYDFILIAPNGSGRFNREMLLTWNAGHCAGFARDSHAKDTEFVNSIIEHSTNTYSIDKKRIYITGMSNGAMLSYKIAGMLTDKIAGFAPVSGAMNFVPKTPKRPIPVIIFHGTADRHVLYNGGIPLNIFEEKDRIDNPVSFAVDFWVKNNKCNIHPVRTQKGNVIIDKYLNCENNANVILYTIVGGNHSWPGGKKDILFSDIPSQEINASEIILDAFIKNSF